MSTKSKILLISGFHYLVIFLIGLGMLKLWSWLFDSRIIITILSIMTLYLVAKNAWEHYDWTINQLEMVKRDSQVSP